MSEITSNLLASALNHKVIAEAFEIARSNRTGILSVVNVSDPMQAYDGYKMGWLDMRVDATSSDTTAAALAAATTVSVADGSKFRSGMLLSPDGSDEVLLVESVSGNDLTVVRGFGGTTAADIADATTLTIDSVAREENSLAETDGIYQPENVENFFQTMDTAVEMSRRALATLQYGDTNDLNFQVQERIRQLAIQMDRALVRGRKATATIAGKERTYTGGIRYFLDQAGAINVDNSAAALTLDQINELNAQIVARGGMANTIAVGIPLARKLNSLVGANYSSQRLNDWSNDEGAVNRLPTDLPLIGSVNQIVIDTNLSDDELIIFDAGMISVKPMAQNNAGESGSWQTKDATQNGQDGQKVRVLGDFSMEVRNSKTHMARLRNIG
tara:strand:- start:1014 stop:2171 length:1158 start_codon:yes stop_codon:yes gene_type:complete